MDPLVGRGFSATAGTFAENDVDLEEEKIDEDEDEDEDEQDKEDEEDGSEDLERTCTATARFLISTFLLTSSNERPFNSPPSGLNFHRKKRPQSQL